MDAWSPGLAVEGREVGAPHQASLADSTRPVSLADDDQAGHDQAARVLLPAFSADGTKQYYAHRSCAGSLPKEQVSQSTYTPFSARTPWQSLAVLRAGSPTSAPCRVECDPVPHVIPDGRKRACTGVQMPSSSSAPLLWKPSGTTSRRSFHHKAGVHEPSGNALRIKTLLWAATDVLSSCAKVFASQCQRPSRRACITKVSAVRHRTSFDRMGTQSLQ